MKTAFDFPLALVRLGVAIALIGAGVGAFVLVHMLYTSDGPLGLAIGLAAAGMMIAAIGSVIDLIFGEK